MKPKFKTGDRVLVKSEDLIGEMGTVEYVEKRDTSTNPRLIWVNMDKEYIPTNNMAFYQKELSLIDRPLDIFKDLINDAI